MNDGSQPFEPFLQNASRFHQLQAQSGIDNIGRREAEVDESGLLTKGFGYSFEEGGHIVTGDFQYLIHAIEMQAGLPYLRNGFHWNDAKLRPGFADSDLNLKPLIEFILV